MDSKPTNAHGDRATIENICLIGLPALSENDGEIPYPAPPSEYLITKKATAITANNKTTASIDCIATARRLPKIQTAPTASIAAMVSSTSPKYTSYSRIL